jgi:hypothetical protein
VVDHEGACPCESGVWRPSSSYPQALGEFAQSGDWRGLSLPAVRRARQNRLGVWSSRRWRRRRTLTHASVTTVLPPPGNTSCQAPALLGIGYPLSMSLLADKRLGRRHVAGSSSSGSPVRPGAHDRGVPPPAPGGVPSDLVRACELPRDQQAIVAANRRGLSPNPDMTGAGVRLGLRANATGKRGWTSRRECNKIPGHDRSGPDPAGF